MRKLVGTFQAKILVVVVAGLVAWLLISWLTFPTDRTPEGAYLRIVSAVNRDRPEAFFAYLETDAQHACFTIRDYRKTAHTDIKTHYPSDEQTRSLRRYEAAASAKSGEEIFAIYARQRGWLDRLRRDLSGMDHVEEGSESEVTLFTSRGTAYPFRKRDNGIWGLTLFTETLVREAETAARDAALIHKAAQVYQKAPRL